MRDGGGGNVDRGVIGGVVDHAQPAVPDGSCSEIAPVHQPLGELDSGVPSGRGVEVAVDLSAQIVNVAPLQGVFDRQPGRSTVQRFVCLPAGGGKFVDRAVGVLLQGNPVSAGILGERVAGIIQQRLVQLTGVTPFAIGHKLLGLSQPPAERRVVEGPAVEVIPIRPVRFGTLYVGGVRQCFRGRAAEELLNDPVDRIAGGILGDGRGSDREHHDRRNGREKNRPPQDSSASLRASREQTVHVFTPPGGRVGLDSA